MRILAQLVVAAAVVVCAAANVSVYHPVVLIPGDGASQLEGKLNKSTSRHAYCTKHTTDYIPLWLSFRNLLPLEINCLVDNIRLWYDANTHTTYNTPGVDIQVPGFGNTSSVEFTDKSRKVRYYHSIVEDLVGVGYIRGVSVKGAPYDFRKAPNELGVYYMRLHQHIEETYTQNNNTKVVVIAHSMGNPVFVYFLNRQSQTWKDKYIQAYISLAGAWGGAVKALRVMASGYNLGMLTVNRLTIREQQRTMPSTAFLMPTDPFWNSSEVLISTPGKNYSISNYDEFFKDINYTTGYLERKDTDNILRNLEPPQVRVHCIHGSNVSTTAALIFGKGEFPDSEPLYMEGNGDGTVNMRSLLGCLRWIGLQKQQIIHKVYTGNSSSHMSLLVNRNVRAYILDVVTGKL